MKQKLHFWNRLKLKDKFLLIAIPSALFSSTIIMILALLIFRGYEKSLYNIAMQDLTMITRHIEREFAKVEDISVDLITDSMVQSALKVTKPNIRTRDISMEQIHLLQAVYKVIQDKINMSDNIVSISIFVEDQWYYTGPASRSFDRTLAEEAEKLLPENGNQLFWYIPEHPASSIYGVRTIRDMYYRTFADEALIVIEYDLKGSMDELIAENNLAYSQKLAVMDGGELLYSNMGELSTEEFVLPENESYRIISLQGIKHFVARLDTSQYGWEYAFVIRYDELFGAMRLFRVLFLIVAAVVLTISVIYCDMLSRTLTRRFTHLTERMKSVKKGNFEPMDVGTLGEKDELEEVCERFEDMVANVDRLIQDNYVKQMSIQQNQLKMLQNQINPHFLFNTLQLVNWQAKESHQEIISEIAESLGKLLRYTLREDNDPACLRDEIEIMMHYVTIQKIRYQEKLNVTVDVPEELQNRLVPKLALQNIVENSIKYALENMLEPCRIQVTGSVKDGVFSLSVRDNGPGIREDVLKEKSSEKNEKAGLQIGLANIRQRIFLLFPEGSDLILTNTGHGTLVEIRLVETTEERKDSLGKSDSGR